MAFGFADSAKLVVDLSLKGNFANQLKASQRALGSFDKKVDQTASRSYRAGQQIGNGIKAGAVLAAAGVGILAANIAIGLDSLINLEKVTAQTVAVIKSTKGAAGQTSQGIRDMANAFENLNATMDDTTIQSGANILLTFTNIRQKAFKPTLQAALDLSTAMGQDLQTSVIQIGKALSDPIKGLTSLMRIGVTFSAQQKDQIAKFYGYSKTELEQRKKLKGSALAQFDANHKLNADYKAQQVILAELNKEFGGSFLAGGQTTAGKVAKFRDAIDDLQRALATALLPAITNVANGLSSFLSDPQTVQDFENLGKDVAKLFSPENIRSGIDMLKSGFGALKAIAGPIADVIGTAVKAFTSLPPIVQQLLVGGFVANKLTGGLITNLAGGLIEGISKAFVGGIKAPLVNVDGAVVNVAGGIGGGLPTGLAGDIEGAVEKGTIAGWSSTAGSGGGLIGLLKGIPYITVGLIASQLGQQAGNAASDAIKNVIPGQPGDIAGTITKTFTDLFSGHPGDAFGDIQHLADVIGQLIPLIGKTPGPGEPGWVAPPGWKPPGANAHGKTQADVEAGRGSRFGPHPTAPHTPTDMVLAARVVKQGVGKDIEALRGDVQRIVPGLAAVLKPTGGGDRGPGTQGDMESRRGQMADALKTMPLTMDEMRASLAKIDANTFNPDVKLDASQIIDLRAPIVDGIEASRGSLAAGLVNNQTATINSAATISASQYGAASSITSAIYAAQPIITIENYISATGVDHTTKKVRHYGPTGGDRQGPSGMSHTPGL